MLQRLRNWLSDDTVEEKDDRGWGLPLWWGAAIVAAFTVAISWCHVPTPPNLLELIDGRPNLTLFRGLIATSGVEGVVASEDLTFIVPTDDAFAELPDDLLTAITSDPELAVQVIRLHVTGPEGRLTDLVAAGSVLTDLGFEARVNQQDGTVFFDTSAVVAGDVEAENGLLHVIDRVLLLADQAEEQERAEPAPAEPEPVTPAEPEEPVPAEPEPEEPAGLPISQLLLERSDVGTLVGILGPVAADLFADGGDGFTVFAPNDAAFAGLPAGSLDLLAATQPKLLELLGYHVVPGTFMIDDLTDGQVLTTQSGAELPVTVVDGVVTVGGITLSADELAAANGVVHIVDGVLLPPDFELPTLNEALGLESITFETASAVITSEGIEALQSTVEFLESRPNVRVAIEGHTDSQGDDAANQTLSEQRADAVRDYLVSEGIAADRLEIAGFGETRPVASNDTAEGRAQNRRIDFRLL